MHDTAGNQYVIGTACKTWRCYVCRKAKKFQMISLVEFGCSILDPWYFITITYEADIREAVDANGVREDWSALLQMLKQKSQNQSLTWMKVPELTKNGMPHLHLIVGGIGERTDDCKNFTFTPCPYNCISCEWRLHWFTITKDSYIIHVKEGYDARGAGNYMGKYVSKGLEYRADLENLGFYRRYSTSRNWPRGEKIQLRGTRYAEWTRIQRATSLDDPMDMERRAIHDSNKWLLQPEGDPMFVNQSYSAQKRRKVTRINNVLKNIQTHSEPEDRGLH